MNFDGINGHRHQLALLSRMLERGMVPQAMLFTGMSGVGKALIARHFFAAMFCTGESKPCMACRNCMQVRKKTFPDLIEIYPDEKGRIPLGNPEKKEPGSIRWLIERLSRKPLHQSMGVIIDGADTISTEGQNALLKSIEEPQENTHIIMTASNRSRVLPTILSRCTAIPFNPLSIEDVRESIKGSCPPEMDPDTAAEIAGGSMEIAGIVVNPEIMGRVIDLAARISDYFNTGSFLVADPGPIVKEIGADRLAAVLINIYRLLLFESMGKATRAKLPERIRMNDQVKARKFIKILLALKKGLSNNLNVKISLKGMLYYIDRMDENSAPEIASILY